MWNAELEMVKNMYSVNHNVHLLDVMKILADESFILT